MVSSGTDRLKGTLDLLILRTLREGSMHGWAIAQLIQARSGDVLHTNQGSLYPALHRLEERGWIRAEWGESETIVVRASINSRPPANDSLVNKQRAGRNSYGR